MKMRGMLLSAEVGEIPLHDISTGEYKPGFGVQASVLDIEEKETYTCQITDGLPGLDDLKAARKSKQPTQVMQQIAANVQAQLPADFTQLMLNVKKVKNSKGFMTLICSVEAIA